MFDLFFNEALLLHQKDDLRKEIVYRN